MEAATRNPVTAGMQFIETLKNVSSKEQAEKALEIISSLPNLPMYRPKAIQWIKNNPDAMETIKITDNLYKTHLHKYFSSAINEVMDYNPKDSEEDTNELAMGIEDEKKEHEDVYNIISATFKDKGVEVPFSLDAFAALIAQGHLKNDPLYYSNQKSDKEPKQPLMGGIDENEEVEMDEAFEYAEAAMKHIFLKEENGVKQISKTSDFETVTNSAIQQAESNSDEDATAQYSIDYQLEYQGKTFELSLSIKDVYSIKYTKSGGDNVITPNETESEDELFSREIDDIFVDGGSLGHDGLVKLHSIYKSFEI